VKVELAELTAEEVEKILLAATSGDGALEEVAQQLKVFSRLSDNVVAQPAPSILLEGGAT
jgi:hypothetical protein